MIIITITIYKFYKIEKSSKILYRETLYIVVRVKAMGGVNKKALAVGAVTLVALAAMAMVYNSAYGTATVKAKKVVWVDNSDISLGTVTLKAPGIWVDETLGTITVHKKNSSGIFDTIQYRLILEIPSFSTNQHSDLSSIRSLAIAVYKNDQLKGFLTPWTPTLVIDSDTWNPTTTDETDEDTYTLKLNGIALKETSASGITLGVRASVEILSVT